MLADGWTPVVAGVAAVVEGVVCPAGAVVVDVVFPKREGAVVAGPVGAIPGRQIIY